MFHVYILMKNSSQNLFLGWVESLMLSVLGDLPNFPLYTHWSRKLEKISQWGHSNKNPTEVLNLTHLNILASY